MSMIYSEDGIFGSGGGGGKGRQQQRIPYEAPNDQGSVVTARFIDILSEGEIEGLVDGAKSIILNDTPLQNKDGTFNFEGVSWELRTGLPSQSHVPGYTTSAVETAVGVEVTHGNPVTRTFTNSNVDYLTPKIRIPVLSSTDKKSGDTNKTSVRLQIHVNDVLKIDETIYRKHVSTFEIAFRISTENVSFPANVKITRITPDSNNNALVNAMAWHTIAEEIEAKLTYPNTAFIALTINAKDFGSSSVSRAYDVKGLKVKVPSNYDPVTATYSGIWDGTFTSAAYTNNPIWCIYDLKLNDRYGVGNHITDNDVNKYKMYEIARWCDELRSNGRGGFERRWTCNGVFETREDAYAALQKLISIFHGMMYYSQGQIQFSADKPEQPTKIFTNANVIGGTFSYQTSSNSTKASVCVVIFNSIEDNYRQASEVVVDNDMLIEIGEVRTEVTAAFCTSQSQAHTYGKWVLYTLNNQPETVIFASGFYATGLYPGRTFYVSDRDIAGIDMGGRVSSVSAATVTIDRDFTFESGKTYELHVDKDDGTTEYRDITNAPGTTSTITIASAFSSAVSANRTFMIKSSSIAPKQWRCISISEAEYNKYEITAIEYNSNKFVEIEQDLVLEEPNTSLFGDFALRAPTNLTFTSRVVTEDNYIRNVISVSWDNVPGALIYEYQYAMGNANFTEMQEASEKEVEISGPDGEYIFRVRAKDVLGRTTLFTLKTQRISKFSTAIPDVTNFTSVRQGTDVLLAWKTVDSEVVKNYEIRKGSSWATAYVVGQTPGNMLTISDPDQSTYLIKAVAIYDKYSDNAVTTQTLPAVKNVVVSRDEFAQNFNGTRVNFSETNAGHIKMIPDFSLDDIGNYQLSGFDGLALEQLWTLVPGIAGLTASYETPAIDLGAVLRSRVTASLTMSVSQSVSLAELAANYPTLADFPTTFILGGDENAVSARILISTSNDNISYSSYVEYLPGFSSFRYIKVKVEIDRLDIENIPTIENLKLSFDVPDQRETHNDLAVSASGLTLNYTNNYNAVPLVVAGVQNGSNGDTVKKNTTINSTTFHVIDSAGAAKSGLIDVFIEGY